MKNIHIIPKEEPKQIKCYCGHTITCDCEPLEVSDEAKQRTANYMSLKGALEPKDVVLGYKTSLDAQMLDKIEPKQETLEEAAEKFWDKLSFDDAFKAGAKWQAERMYSEEDMIEFAEFVATYPDKNKNINGQILHAKSKYDGSERTVDLLEQFKKK